jgi:alpha-L-rhamnosidase
MNVEVPVGSNATVHVPAEAPADVTESGQPIVDGPHLSFKGVEDGYAVYSVASGEYHFSSPALH